MSKLAVLRSPFEMAASWMDRLVRRGVLSQLAGLRRGELTLHASSETFALGEPSELQAALRVHRPRFFRQAFLGGTLSVAESYLRGDWDCDDLTSLFRIFARNRHSTEEIDRGWARFAGFAHRIFHKLHANTRAGSRRNIAAHYDLGNEFYRLWLDETMAYSSGIFPTWNATLREASINKFDLICRNLDLNSEDEVLEIGSGWGGFAIHAASNYGCHVTTTTISGEQFDIARQRVDEAGLRNRVKLLQQDYRDLSGRYDKLVSIEMIEAVGHRFYDDYFRQCGQLLRPDGSFVLQAIVMPDRGYEKYLKSVDFIQRYVFPGGCLPSLGAILSSVARVTDLEFVQAHDYSPHYAETLRRWRHAFHRQIEDIRGLGYSEEFIRLWNYYLCYCEAAFEERAVGVLQVQFDKPERIRASQDVVQEAEPAGIGVSPAENGSMNPRQLSACGT